jgi:hypothetical protein
MEDLREYLELELFADLNDVDSILEAPETV